MSTTAATMTATDDGEGWQWIISCSTSWRLFYRQRFLLSAYHFPFFVPLDDDIERQYLYRAPLIVSFSGSSLWHHLYHFSSCSNCKNNSNSGGGVVSYVVPKPSHIILSSPPHRDPIAESCRGSCGDYHISEVGIDFRKVSPSKNIASWFRANREKYRTSIAAHNTGDPAISVS